MADKDSRAGSRYDTPEIRAFTARVHAPHDDALQAAFDAPGSNDVPAIQVGPDEGRTLHLLLKLIAAKRVVEVGTLVGYSGIWIARALPDDGELITLERSPKHAEIARARFEQAGLADKVTILVGDAAESLKSIEGEVCAVFVDADKGGYAEYGRWAATHLRAGGLLVGDNAYLFGRLLDESDEASAMRAFHEESAAKMVSVCLPTPDGLVLALKE